jgi:Cdc6-like AAA superfamily ATPase
VTLAHTRVDDHRTRGTTQPFDIQLGMRHVYHPAEIRQEPFGMRREDFRYHLYVVGKTGTGKSTLLKSVVAQAIAAGMGVGVWTWPHDRGHMWEEISPHPSYCF